MKPSALLISPSRDGSSHEGTPALEMEYEYPEQESAQLISPRKLGTPRTPKDVEAPPSEEDPVKPPSTIESTSVLTKTGLQVLVLLAVQNCSKNLLMRHVMKDRPDFLTSAAVLGCEATKLTLSVLYILIIDRGSLESIYQFLKDDFRNMLLLSVPAGAYNLQMSLEYVALANLNAAVFSVLVQTKLLATATFSSLILKTKLKVVQIISLLLLTVGVMLINIDNIGTTAEDAKNVAMKGIIATLGIALSSGFASVYTEKVIKAQRSKTITRQNYSLAYLQVQLALASMIIIGLWAVATDYKKIMEFGLWHNFTPGAYFSIFNSAIGGLTVAAVLKYADSVLKGYATAMSVVLTGVASMILFDTTLNAVYALGIINVVCAVLLYNAKNLDRNVGCYSN